MEEIKLEVSNETTMVTISIPKVMDSITASGVANKLKEAARFVGENTIKRKHVIDCDGGVLLRTRKGKIRKIPRYTNAQKIAFIAYCDKNGIEAAMKKYNINTKKKVHDKRYHFKKSLGLNK